MDIVFPARNNNQRVYLRYETYRVYTKGGYPLNPEVLQIDVFDDTSGERVSSAVARNTMMGTFLEFRISTPGYYRIVHHNLEKVEFRKSPLWLYNLLVGKRVPLDKIRIVIESKHP